MKLKKKRREKEFLKEEANAVTFCFASSLVCFLSEFDLINNSLNLYLE